jgi:hypothetical protein
MSSCFIQPPRLLCTLSCSIELERLVSNGLGRQAEHLFIRQFGQLGPSRVDA